VNLLRSNLICIIHTADDPVGALNLLNNYFINVGKNLADKFSKNTYNNSNANKKFDVQYFHERFLNKVEVSEVLLIINNCRYDTAVGHYRITVKIFKTIIEQIVNLFVHIFNLSIKNSTFPDDLKLLLSNHYIREMIEKL
jgi:hypothetical protein